MTVSTSKRIVLTANEKAVSELEALVVLFGWETGRGGILL
jgi:hypothetical protein